jgi:hypothetical protein
MVLAFPAWTSTERNLGREEGIVTLHERRSVTGRRGRDPIESRQGAYGSGGSYGVGGGFADDEPGAKTEDSRETVPDLGSATEAPKSVVDVHTRESELNDEYLRDVRGTDQKKNGPAPAPSRTARRRR